ncbi:MAG: DUF2313 domain-containing protein [Roseomonas sp.]|nr:DUF2313 domain-containing protein [Roseomonas sp.]
MTRAAEDCLAELLALLPPGRGLARVAASNTGRFLKPIAAEMAALEATRARLLAQISPGNAVELLEDYERILGPDPCARDLVLETIDQRQRYAELRWNPPPDPRPATLVALAAMLGVAITVETFDPDVCGAGECGEEMGPETEAYTWLVNAPLTALIDGECGAGECGEPINDFAAPLIECVLRQWVPVHRLAVFSYS